MGQNKRKKSPISMNEFLDMTGPLFKSGQLDNNRTKNLYNNDKNTNSHYSPSFLRDNKNAPWNSHYCQNTNTNTNTNTNKRTSSSISKNVKNLTFASAPSSGSSYCIDSNSNSDSGSSSNSNSNSNSHAIKSAIGLIEKGGKTNVQENYRVYNGRVNLSVNIDTNYTAPVAVAAAATTTDHHHISRKSRHNCNNFIHSNKVTTDNVVTCRHTSASRNGNGKSTENTHTLSFSRPSPPSFVLHSSTYSFFFLLLTLSLLSIVTVTSCSATLSSSSLYTATNDSLSRLHQTAKPLGNNNNDHLTRLKRNTDNTNANTTSKTDTNISTSIDKRLDNEKKNDGSDTNFDPTHVFNDMVNASVQPAQPQVQVLASSTMDTSTPGRILSEINSFDTASSSEFRHSTSTEPPLATSPLSLALSTLLSLSSSASSAWASSEEQFLPQADALIQPKDENTSQGSNAYRPSVLPHWKSLPNAGRKIVKSNSDSNSKEKLASSSSIFNRSRNRSQNQNVSKSKDEKSSTSEENSKKNKETLEKKPILGPLRIFKYVSHPDELKELKYKKHGVLDDVSASTENSIVVQTMNDNEKYSVFSMEHDHHSVDTTTAASTTVSSFDDIMIHGQSRENAISMSSETKGNADNKGSKNEPGKENENFSGNLKFSRENDSYERYQTEMDRQISEEWRNKNIREKSLTLIPNSYFDGKSSSKEDLTFGSSSKSNEHENGDANEKENQSQNQNSRQKESSESSHSPKENQTPNLNPNSESSSSSNSVENKNVTVLPNGTVIDNDGFRPRRSPFRPHWHRDKLYTQREALYQLTPAHPHGHPPPPGLTPMPNTRNIFVASASPQPQPMQIQSQSAQPIPVVAIPVPVPPSYKSPVPVGIPVPVPVPVQVQSIDRDFNGGPSPIPLPLPGQSQGQDQSPDMNDAESPEEGSSMRMPFFRRPKKKRPRPPPGHRPHPDGRTAASGQGPGPRRPPRGRHQGGRGPPPRPGSGPVPKYMPPPRPVPRPRPPPGHRGPPPSHGHNHGPGHGPNHGPGPRPQPSNNNGQNGGPLPLPLRSPPPHQYTYPKNAANIQDILSYFKTEENEIPGSNSNPSMKPHGSSNQGSFNSHAAAAGGSGGLNGGFSNELRDIQGSLLKDIREFAKRPTMLANGEGDGGGENFNQHNNNNNNDYNGYNEEPERGRRPTILDHSRERKPKPVPVPLPASSYQSLDDPDSDPLDDIFNPKPKPVRAMVDMQQRERERERARERERERERDRDRELERERERELEREQIELERALARERERERERELEREVERELSREVSSSGSGNRGHFESDDRPVKGHRHTRKRKKNRHNSPSASWRERNKHVENYRGDAIEDTTRENEASKEEAERERAREKERQREREREVEQFYSDERSRERERNRPLVSPSHNYHQSSKSHGHGHRSHRQKGHHSSKGTKYDDDHHLSQQRFRHRSRERHPAASSIPQSTPVPASSEMSSYPPTRLAIKNTMDEAYYRQRNRPIVIKRPYSPYRPVDIKKLEEEKRNQDKYWNTVTTINVQHPVSQPKTKHHQHHNQQPQGQHSHSHHTSKHSHSSGHTYNRHLNNHHNKGKSSTRHRHKDNKIAPSFANKQPLQPLQKHYHYYGVNPVPVGAVPVMPMSMPSMGPTHPTRVVSSSTGKSTRFTNDLSHSPEEEDILEIHTGAGLADVSTTPVYPSELGSYPVHDREKKARLQKMYMDYLQNKLESQAESINMFTTPAPPISVPVKTKPKPMRMKIHIYPNEQTQVFSSVGGQGHGNANVNVNGFYPSSNPMVSLNPHHPSVNINPYLSASSKVFTPVMNMDNHRSYGHFNPPVNNPIIPAQTMIHTRQQQPVSPGQGQGQGAQTNVDKNKNVVLHLHVHRRNGVDHGDDHEMSGSEVRTSTVKPLTYDEIYETSNSVNINIAQPPPNNFQQNKNNDGQKKDGASGQESRVVTRRSMTANDNRMLESVDSDKSLSMELPIQQDKIEDVLHTLLKLRD